MFTPSSIVLQQPIKYSGINWAMSLRMPYIQGKTAYLSLSFCLVMACVMMASVYFLSEYAYSQQIELNIINERYSITDEPLNRVRNMARFAYISLGGFVLTTFLLILSLLSNSTQARAKNTELIQENKKLVDSLSSMDDELRELNLAISIVSKRV